MVAIISTVTIGADIFSVYALTVDPVADATTFWNGRLGAAATAWAAASADDKARALVAASDWIDRALNFTGTKTVSTQVRDWPRDGATNNCTDEAIADGTIPTELADATFWLAGNIVVDPTIVDAAGQGSNVKSAKAGSAKVEFFQPTIGEAEDTRLPVVAHDYVICFLEGTGDIIAPGGTGDTSDSAFDCDDFERTEGFS